MTTSSSDVTIGSLRDGAGSLRSAGRSPALVASAVACFALLTWAGARIAVPLPFTPVPATLQTLAVLCAGLFLGAGGGAASQVLYLSMGLAGVPVFALPGAGPAYLLGPTGGYLLGFAAGAWVTGRISGLRRGRRVPTVPLSLLAGSAVIHACGLAWLALQSGKGVAAALVPAPLVLFDLAKIVLAAAIYLGVVRPGRSIGSPWSRASRP